MIFEGERTVQIAEVDEDLSKYERIQVGEISIEIIPTAGHTAGGVSLRIGDALFTGDNIIGRKMGRADLPGGNAVLLKESVEKLLQLPEHITIYPGHGKPVTIVEVKQHMQKLAGVA
jgi:glyoxylase-like metal-dependent hydrolase (beta-lactamase superfamily II)